MFCCSVTFFFCILGFVFFEKNPFVSHSSKQDSLKKICERSWSFEELNLKTRNFELVEALFGFDCFVWIRNQSLHWIGDDNSTKKLDIKEHPDNVTKIFSRSLKDETGFHNDLADSFLILRSLWKLILLIKTSGSW